MLYSDREQLLSIDAGLVLVGVLASVIHSFFAFESLASGSEVSLVHNAIAFGLLAYLFWAHWRLPFDLVADIFKIELVLVVAGFGLVFSTIVANGVPENTWAVPEIRVALALTITMFYAGVCGFLFALLRSFIPGGGDIPSPDDF